MEIHSIARYFEGDYLEVTKIFKIECLRNQLQEIEDLDFIKFDGKRTIQEIPDEDYEIYLGSDHEHISVRFNEPLNKGDIKHIVITYSFTSLVKKHFTAHATSVIYPTDLLVYDYTPVRKFKRATLFQYENREDFLANKQSIYQEKISLNKASSSFKGEISNPPLNAHYRIVWE